MLTIFACPKPFTDPHIAIIQRNAITSWTLLRPKPEIILFGDEPGTSEICQELGLRHVPEVARNEFGTPLLNDIFKKAQHLAANDILCYVNADILLTNSLMQAIQLIFHRFQTNFILFCTPWNVWISDLIDFNDDWERRLENLVQQIGNTPQPIGVDVLTFPRYQFTNLPPFLLGRQGWDNWIIYQACHSAYPAIDATPYVFSVHQNHEGTTHVHKHNYHGLREREVKFNLNLAGYWARSFVAADIPYVLQRDGSLIKRPWWQRIKTRFRAVITPLWIIFLEKTLYLRRILGLSRRSRTHSH